MFLNYVTSAHSDGKILVTLFVAAVGEKIILIGKNQNQCWMINEHLLALYGNDLEE